MPLTLETCHLRPRRVAPVAFKWLTIFLYPIGPLPMPILFIRYICSTSSASDVSMASCFLALGPRISATSEV
ncbi:MAG: hypothetical protein C0496_02955 [Erythrobacter sp.]|nr:hypothetical protein [Erythrobacter sp.]